MGFKKISNSMIRIKSLALSWRIKRIREVYQRKMQNAKTTKKWKDKNTIQEVQDKKQKHKFRFAYAVKKKNSFWRVFLKALFGKTMSFQEGY